MPAILKAARLMPPQPLDIGVSPSAPAAPRINEALLNRLLDRVEKAYATFRAELLIYRAGSIAAMAIVILAAARTVVFTRPTPVDLGAFLGAGGLFALTGERATYFLRDNLNLLKMVIERVLDLKGES